MAPPCSACKATRDGVADDALITWQLIRDTIMARIRAHDYPPGALIPNEADIATEFGCARATVNRALRDLADAGFLDRRRKAGTRVRAEPLRKATLDIPVIRREIEAKGQRYDYLLLLRQVLPSPAHVAAQLGLTEPQQVLHLQTLHRADGHPHMFEDRWVFVQTVPRMLDADLDRISPNEWLVRNAPYTHGTMRFTAALAGEVARHLACAATDPVLLLDRTTWLEDRPITWVRQVFERNYGPTLEL